MQVHTNFPASRFGAELLLLHNHGRPSPPQHRLAGGC
jgi:hypothetical protein